MPVEMVEAAVVRHYTSRAGDPHRHLHVLHQAAGASRVSWGEINGVDFAVAATARAAIRRT